MSVLEKDKIAYGEKSEFGTPAYTVEVATKLLDWHSDVDVEPGDMATAATVLRHMSGAFKEHNSSSLEHALMFAVSDTVADEEGGANSGDVVRCMPLTQDVLQEAQVLVLERAHGSSDAVIKLGMLGLKAS